MPLSWIDSTGAEETRDVNKNQGHSISNTDSNTSEVIPMYFLYSISWIVNFDFDYTKKLVQYKSKWSIVIMAIACPQMQCSFQRFAAQESKSFYPGFSQRCTLPVLVLQVFGLWWCCVAFRLQSALCVCLDCVLLGLRIYGHPSVFGAICFMVLGLGIRFSVSANCLWFWFHVGFLGVSDKTLTNVFKNSQGWWKKLKSSLTVSVWIKKDGLIY